MTTGSSSIFSTWLRLAKRYPVAFNSFTGGSLCLCSDAFAQYLEHNQQQKSRRNHGSGAAMMMDEKKDDEVTTTTTTISYRIRRLLSAGMIGAVFGGWVYPTAYARLDSLWKGTNFIAVVQKSIVEILTVGIFVNSISMTSRGLLVGRPVQDVTTHVGQEMPIVTMTDAKVWLPYNMIAFSIIPVTIRPTTTLMMESGWQTYISIMSNNYHHHHNHEEAVVESDDTKEKETSSRFNIGGQEMIATSPSSTR